MELRVTLILHSHWKLKGPHCHWQNAFFLSHGSEFNTLLRGILAELPLKRNGPALETRAPPGSARTPASARPLHLQDLPEGTPLLQYKWQKICDYIM